jgi:hypothetical protein
MMRPMVYLVSLITPDREFHEIVEADRGSAYAMAMNMLRAYSGLEDLLDLVAADENWDGEYPLELSLGPEARLEIHQKELHR